VAITYSAGVGTTITTSAKNGTIKSFTGGQVRFEEDISISNNGNLVASPSYAGRLIYIDGGTGSGQTRYITAQQTGQGDGGDVDIDVSEAWTTDPDGTSTYQISYIVEDCDTLAGVAFVTRSGFWEWKRELVIDGSGTFAFLFFAGAAPHEWRDNGSTSVGSVHVASNGRFDCGYDFGGTPVFGPTNVVINGTDAEVALSAASGSFTNLFDFVLIGTTANNRFLLSGGTHVWQKGKMQTCAYQTHLIGTVVGGGWTFAGNSTVNDDVRIEDTCTVDGVVLEAMNGWDSLDDGLTETLEVRNCIFLNTVTRNVWVHDDKTWNFVNPVNLGSDATLVAFEVDDLNEVNVLFSVAIAVTEPDGTAIVDADCYVYEGTLNQDLPTANRVDTDANGLASTDVLVSKFTFPASVFTTVTSGAHALKIYEWLKIPFVTALTPDFTVTGGLSVGVVLIDNPNIVQTTQATAISAGSGITIEQPTNPTTLLSYDTGTIAFGVGDVVTGLTSGAVGTVTEVTEGTTTAGRIHLRVRNSTAFIAGEQLQVSAVTNAQATNPLVALDFSTHIDSNVLSVQTVHDYWAARQAEDTISADGIVSLTWGAGEHAEIVFANGADSFRTERNVGATDGVFMSDYGAGTVSYMTADDGTQYVPPVTVTLSVECRFNGSVREGIRVRIEETDGTLIVDGNTNASGIFSSSFTYTIPVAVNIVVRQKSYKFQTIAATIQSTGLAQGVSLVASKTVNLP
jgi:hypothetical protein